MKKLAALLMMLSMGVFVVGCGQGETESTPAGGTTPAAGANGDDDTATPVDDSATTDDDASTDADDTDAGESESDDSEN